MSLAVANSPSSDVKHFQTRTFQLAEVDDVIHTYFRNLKVTTSDEELYKASLAAEPREAVQAQADAADGDDP